MLLFGHIGVTLGAVWALSAAAPSPTAQAPAGQSNSLQVRHKIGRLLRFPDFRLVLVGSLLPDVIDKPLWLLGSALSSGRALTHSLLFQVALIAVGVVLYWRYGRVGLWSLAVGSLFHTLEDEMWLAPGTYLWPAYGWAFPHRAAEGWLSHILYGLLHDPRVYVPEVLGAIFIVLFALTLRRRGRLGSFLRAGTIW